MSLPGEHVHAVKFQGWIAEVLGLHFGPDKFGWLEELAERRAAATGCRSALEYLNRLQPGGDFFRAEQGPLIDLLTVGETFFFRNNNHFEAWAELFLAPRLATVSESNPLRILSAGCASGEEPYTLAILLQAKAPHLPASQLSIQALDLNRTALNRAEAGVYSTWSLRQTPDAIRAEYFRPVGNQFQLREDIRRRVSFREVNLAQGNAAVWREPQYDAIFCRNVLMYFTPDTMQAVVERLTALLKPGGALFLGHAETLRGLSQAYHLCHSHETFYYRRKAAGDTAADPGYVPRGAAVDAARPVEPPLAIDWPAAIEEASRRIRSLHAESGQASAASAARVRETSGPPTNAIRRQTTTAMVLELMRVERFSEALEMLKTLPAEAEPDLDTQLLLAVLLINAGRLVEGRAACQALLARDDLNAGAHYLMALCHEQSSETAEAVRHNQAALYLDPTFSIPQLHLGLIARRAGDVAGAVNALRQAQLLLAREDASRILLFGGGFTREALIEMCAVELRRWGGVA